MNSSEASIDFETYGEAGYVYDVARQHWGSLPGHSDQKRGIKAVGADNYTNHPTFHPLSIHFCVNGQRYRETFPDAHLGVKYPCPFPFAAHIASGGIVKAWNVGFDAHYVWLWCVKNWGWPPIPFEQQRCSMAKAKAAAYPGGLDNAAAVLGTPAKDAIGKRLISKLTVPKNPTRKAPALRWVPQTAPHDFEVFYQYGDQDVVAEMAIDAKLPELLPLELEVWRVDQRINRRGMYINLPRVDDCISILEQAIERANAELKRLTVWPIEATDANGQPTYAYVPAVESYTEVASIVKWLEWRKVHTHSLDEERLGELLKRVDLAPDVLRVLKIRQELAYGSVKKLYALKAQTSTVDSRIREQYEFSSAHTTLWNGRGAQPANFPRPMHDSFEKRKNVERALSVIATRSIEALDYEYGRASAWARDPTNARPEGLDPLEVVASCLRSLIAAAPGYRLISADFNSIQAVVTSCLANEAWRIKVFETHGKIYEAMASRISGVPLEEILAFKERTGKHHALRQNPGKLAVLSSDFGAWVNGWKRFGADKLLGSDDNIKAVILKTNAAQPAIVELRGGQVRNRFQWNEAEDLFGLEGAIIKAIREPGVAFEATTLGNERADGTREPNIPTGVVYQVHDDTLYCRVPSGGFIRYHSPRLHPPKRDWARAWEQDITYEGWNTNANKAAQGWQTMPLYAGVAVQNVVAKVSRDVQALALLRIEAAGYPVVMHTHDENVTEVPIGSHHTAAEHTLLTGMLPEWARFPDGRPWPIRVPDSWEAPIYGKW